MVYSTCTLNPNENDGVVGKFLRENTDFVIQPINLFDVESDIINTNGVTLFPHVHGCDGFYIAKIKRIK